jgi:hypothetical protein
MVGSLDRLLGDVDGLADKMASENPRLPGRDRVLSDARNLTTRLLLVRQNVLGQVPREQANQALADLEMSWRQFQDRLPRRSQGKPQYLQALERDMSEVFARNQTPVSKPR